jgi:hypothetical protein
MSMKIEISDKFDISKEEFELLDSHTPYIHNLSYDSLTAWWDHFKSVKNNHRIGDLKQLAIVKVFRNSKISTLIPLALVHQKKFRYFRFKQLEFLSQQHGGPLLSFIGFQISPIEYSEVLKALKRNIKFDFLECNFLPKDANFTSCMIPTSITLFIHLDRYNDYLDYQTSKYDRKFKKNIERRRNLFFDEGGKFVIKKFEELSETVLSEIRKVGATKSAATGKTDILSEKLFWEYIIKHFKTVNSRVMLALLNDQIVGYHFTYYIHTYMRIYSMLAYHRDYKKYGIGNLIDDEELRTEKFQNCKMISMGGGVSEYKLKFADSFAFTYTWFQRGNTLKSFIFSKLLIERLKDREEKLNILREKLLEKGLNETDIFKSF